MKTAITAAIAAALLVTVPAGATAPATTSGHDAGAAKVYPLGAKVTKLLPALANRGIKKRLRGAGFEITGYDSECTRLSNIKLRCKYGFTHKLGDAFGTGPLCGTTTVKLVRKGKAMSVGPTPTDSCS